MTPSMRKRPIQADANRLISLPFFRAKRTWSSLLADRDTNDPDVWSGRALQENFADLAVSGLASMYPTFDWSVAPGHHGYQRACDLISGKASRRPNGSPVLARAGKTEPPCRLVLSQTSAGNSQFFTQTKRLTPWLASPRSFGHEPERSKQSWPVCWQARSQEHCGAAASWRPRSRP